MSGRWYVVQTHVHSENKAVAHLSRQGFDVYLPRYLKRRRHARKVDTVAAPLFPRYMFVAIDIHSQQWRSIRSTIGVSGLVCNGDQPASVSDDVIHALRDREDESGYVQLSQRPRFLPGSRVEITNGAFASYLGLFENMRDNERVTVLLDLLGRKVRVVIDEMSLAAA